MDDELDDNVITLSVSEEWAGQRLDKAVSGLIADYSRTRIQALIEEGALSIRGKVITDSKYKVTSGDEIEMVIPPPVDDTPRSENIPLDIVYEDDDLLVINKQSGLTVHPGAGQREGTLVNALLYHCGSTLSGIGGVKRPGIVHRLDKDTSGLMVVAKHDRAHHGLSAQLADRTLGRVYAAFVWRVPAPIKGSVTQPIGRHPTHRLKMAVRGREGREATTHYLVKESYGDRASWVECVLESGRTHQIRVHMGYLKHPLIGDPLYGLPDQEARSILSHATLKDKDQHIIASFPRQALHAREIHFIHPGTDDEMSFESDLPTDLQSLRQTLQKI
ncbi:MAG: RluA family pseudouridine synthase [Alphaproteobacteria bacterium]|nr:RluA family pseudouridine synthase [Alphaproteobacteria bacterium]